MREKIALLLVFLAVVAAANEAVGLDRYVPDPNFAIQDAICDACDGDTIIVQPGAYVENIRFYGRAITVRSSDPNDPCVVAATIIDGSDPCDPVFGSVVTFWDGEGRDSVLDGFTLTKGVGKGSGSSRVGGGILCVQAGPTVRNCVITGNGPVNITFGAGIVCSLATDPLFSNCIIRDNESSWVAAGMYCGSSTVTMKNCQFIGNRAPGAAAAWIYDSQRLSIHGAASLFRDNRSDYEAGAILADQSMLSLRKVSFIGNVAAGGHGGAMFLRAGSSGEVENCTFAGNRGLGSAAMYCEGESVFSVTNSVFVNNQATGWSEAGGGLHCVGGSDPQVSNCIIRDNGPRQIYISGGYAEVNFCNLQDSTGNHNIDIDPCFVQEGYWNDPNIFDAWINGNYHLKDESPCIDAGDPNYIPRLEQKDIDEEPRYSGFTVDMGIDEKFPQARVYNQTQTQWYQMINDALVQANDGDELITCPGRYVENILYRSNVKLRSAYPDRSESVAATLIDGSAATLGPILRSSVTFRALSTSGGELNGFTVVGGDQTVGAGIRCSGVAASIKQCVIEDNVAQLGGAVAAQAAIVTLDRCIIRNNAASDFGGGVAVMDDADVSLNNCAIVANVAAEGTGAGVHCQSGATCQIDFCTIKDNDNYGLYADPCAEVSVENTIFWNNDPNDPNEPDNVVVAEDALLTIDYSNIPGGWPYGAGNIDQDPLFEAHIEYLGDPNDPNDDLWWRHDYRLQDTSPCINAGDPDHQDDPDNLDLDNQTRPQYCRVDIGADEVDGIYELGKNGVIYNVNESESYCSITEALEEVQTMQMLIVGPGRYHENIVIDCCDVYLRGSQPSDANTVALTIIDGGDPCDPCYGPTITLPPHRAGGTTIAGITIVGGAGYLPDPCYDQRVGGGIYCKDNDNVTVEQCWFTANGAHLGGAAYFQNSDNLTLDKCYFVDNVAVEGAGIYLSALQDPYIGYSMFTGNIDTDFGSAMRLADCCDVILDHNIIADNGPGSAIFATTLHGLDIDFCTLYGNDAYDLGGGLSALSSLDITITNSIFWNDSPDEIYTNDANKITVTYSDVRSGYPGAGNLHVDPCLIDPYENDFRLRPNSPLINHGDPCYAPPLPAVDFAGMDRVAWTRVDIGAYECHDADPNHLPQVVHNETQGKWYHNLAAALLDVAPGERIVLSPGTYTENVTIDPNDVTLASVAPSDSSTVAQTIIDGSAPADPDHASVITLTANSAHGFTLDGLTLRGGAGWRDANDTAGDPCDDLWYGGGIYCSAVDRLTIRRSRILDNHADIGAGMYLHDADHLVIKNCIIAHNSADKDAGGIRIDQCPAVHLAFNTIADNSAQQGAGGISLVAHSHGDLTNSILWHNNPDQIHLADGSSIAVSYCDLQTGYPGWANMDADPYFVDPNSQDYRLRTCYQQWHTTDRRTSDLTGDGAINLSDFSLLAANWYAQGPAIASDFDNDTVVGPSDLVLFAQDYLNPDAWITIGSRPNASVCLDAGDPRIDPASEQHDTSRFRGDNQRVNIGAYGNTAEAAIAPRGWTNLADLSNDGIVDTGDILYFTPDWLCRGDHLPADLNADDKVDLSDFAIIGDNLLWQRPN